MKILNQLRSYKILKDVFKTEKILCVLIQVLTRSHTGTYEILQELDYL